MESIVPLETLLLLLVISFFTIIQSIFGVGLLVFGTPTLLLMGYSFPETLSYLLPCSIIVSFLQVYQGWNRVNKYRFNVIFYMLPTLIIGLLLILLFFELSLHLIMGSVLLLTSLTRLSPSLNKALEFSLSNNFKIGFLFTGFIHGLTNLGGAPLVIITNGIYNAKKDIQPNIAYAYLFMALIQITLLIFMNEFVFSQFALLFPIVSGLIYLFFGKFIFDFTAEKFYRDLMTFFILFYGILLIVKSL